MTIPEAVSLVMLAGTYADGGEIFVLDMGSPVKIVDTNLVCDVYAVKGCFLAFRSKCIQEVGYYDEEFFLFEEEKVIASKFEKSGYKSAVLTDVSYIHNHSVTINKEFRKFGQSKRIVLRSNELFLRKYMGVGNVKMVIIKLYHTLCIVESVIYEWILSLK